MHNSSSTQEGNYEQTTCKENTPMYPKKRAASTRHLYYRDSSSTDYKVPTSSYLDDDKELNEKVAADTSSRKSTSKVLKPPSDKPSSTRDHKLKLPKKTKTSNLRAEWMRDGATIPSTSQKHLHKYKRLPFQKVQRRGQCNESMVDRLLRLKEMNKIESNDQ